MRRRYRYDEVRKEMVEVSPDWSPTERRAPVATEEIVYGSAVATDGTPINTKRRHREYMKQNGVAHASDYSPQFYEKKAVERARVMSGEADTKARKEAIARSIDILQHQKRR